MLRHRRHVAVVVVALVAVAAELAAAGAARIWGSVRDSSGEPVAGVKITVTLFGVESFRLEATTGARGEYEIALVDATRTYAYAYEKAGFQAQHESLKVAVGSNERHDVELLTPSEAERRLPAGRDATPAERAVLAFNRGVEATETGDRAQAVARFEEAVRLDPRLAAARSALAVLRLEESQWTAAAEQAEAALALEPADAQALRVLFTVYFELGDEPRWRAAAQRLAALAPAAAAVALYDRGTAAFDAGDADAARRLAESAVAFDASHARAHYLLGLCLAGTDAARAKEHLETYLRLAPDDVDAATAREMLRYLK